MTIKDIETVCSHQDPEVTERTYKILTAALLAKIEVLDKFLYLTSDEEESLFRDEIFQKRMKVINELSSEYNKISNAAKDVLYCILPVDTKYKKCKRR